MVLWNCLILLLSVIGWIGAHQEELVWLEDLNGNHNLRDVDSALPTLLHFNVKRLSGDPVKLHLQENKRLNANAPVYVGGSLNGKPTAKEADVPLISDTKFYHDRRLGAAVKVSCVQLPFGACKRVLEGSVHIDGDNYEIEPSPISFNLRSMRTEKSNPHILRKIESSQTDEDGNLRGLYAADYKYITDEEKEGVAEHDHKQVPGEPNVRGYPESNDDTRFPGKPNIPLNIEDEFRSLLYKTEIDDKIKELYGDKRQKQAKNDNKLYAVEVIMVVDSSLWDKYYAKVEANNGMNKDTATMFFLRERLAHIMNGVSLRYEEIEDPGMNVYVTISQFLIYKARNASNPLSPNVNTPVQDGITYANSDIYIDGLVGWIKTAPLNEHDDHVMVITGYELYYMDENNNMRDGVAGVAYVSGACGKYRVSVQEDRDYFTTTSVAAHELGHNLGSTHDGYRGSINCSKTDMFIMAPYVASFKKGQPYSLNPWRFSPCSVEAFKTYFGSGKCFLDHGDYYDKNEWKEHNEQLPGERYTPDEQCKLVKGDNSGVCSDMDPVEICRVMPCSEPGKISCDNYAAARGTPCDRPELNKWCIDGQCIERGSVATTKKPVTTPKSNTTTTQSFDTTTQSMETTSNEQGTTYYTETTAGSCVNLNWQHWTCEEVSNYFWQEYGYEPRDWCRDSYWKHLCCRLCQDSSHPVTTPGCMDIGYHSWTCEKVSDYFKEHLSLEPRQWCSDPDWKSSCCNYCGRNGR